MNYSKLKGMVAATFTPFDEKGEVNYNIIYKYSDWIASSPICGVFVNGTTAEFMSLTIDERKQILEHWVKAAKKRFKIIAHVGSNCQKDSIDLTVHAKLLGVDAIASIAPSFFKPDSITELINYLAPIASGAPSIPFYYYNMPSMTGVNLPVDLLLVEGKKRMPNLVGTKYTHNNLMEMGACLNLCNGEFEVLHGYDEILICGIAMGAIAGVGSTYNYIPNVYDQIFKAMERNDVKTAQKAQMNSIKIVEIIIKYGGGVRGGKAVMKLIGIDCGECRSPISTFSNIEYDNMLNDLNNIQFYEYLK